MFEPGKSGNPRGRPAKSQQQKDFEAKCAGYSALYAFDKLKKWIDGPDKKVAQWAMSEMLNRGFGKAVEFVEANVTQDAGISPADVAREITELVGGGKDKGSAADSPTKVDGGK